MCGRGHLPSDSHLISSHFTSAILPACLPAGDGDGYGVAVSMLLAVSLETQERGKRDTYLHTSIPAYVRPSLVSAADVSAVALSRGCHVMSCRVVVRVAVAVCVVGRSIVE